MTEARPTSEPVPDVVGTAMMAAASMGATAFQKGLGAIHALSHPVGALYDTHHGLTNAVVMPYVLEYNRSAIDERLTRLARYLNLPNPSFKSLLDWILALRKEIGIPHTLKDIGVGSASLMRRMPSSAMPSASGWKPGAQ